MPVLRRWSPARLLVPLTVAAVLVSGAAPAGAATRTGYERTVRLTFPVKGPVSYTDTYHAGRDGGARVHQGTDIMAAKMQRVYAARAGTVCHITGVTEPVPSYGYMISICGTDGLRISYVHLNNDTPGTDDGKGGVEHAYAPKVRKGVKVVRGQLLGYVGDSGNAEGTAPHLHFEISDPALDDPRIQQDRYDPQRINPYYSLRRAEARDDYPGVTFPRQTEPEPTAPDPEPDPEPTPPDPAPPEPTDLFRDIAGSTHREAVNRIAAAGITGGCTADRFCPELPVTRAQMASFVTRAAVVPYVTAVAFDDITDNPHAAAINALAAAGVIQGCGDRQYCPSELVTRAQMATFLARAFKLRPVAQPTYRDVSPYANHAAAIAAISEAGITSGCSARRFCPGAVVTRAQMATFMDRAAARPVSE